MSHSRFSSSEDVFEYLKSYVNVEKGQATVFKLDRMLALASALGNPHMGRLTIHVAGSKGKGSVSTMAAGILSAQGLTTGLYTSPHLLRWKERIAFADAEMPEKILIAAMEEVIPLVEGKAAHDFPGGELPTYFELSTLVAFCAFRATGCDAQVIETGLGGRLDSTNIVEPDVSVITPIELEHTQFLGDSIAAIAFEKAGIIKPGKPVCISRQKPDAAEVFERQAVQKGSPLFRLGRDVDVEDVKFDRTGTRCRLVAGNAGIRPDLRYGEARASDALPEGLRHLLMDEGVVLRCPMAGKVQADNMAIAVMAAFLAVPTLEKEAVRKGLARSRLQARFEMLPTEPPVILDGAHTPDSVRLALDAALALYSAPRILLFACALDKHHAEMAAILAGHFDRTIVTKPGDFKASDPEEVYRSFKALDGTAVLEADTAAAIDMAFAEAKSLKAMLLVTGSFYLCAEAKARLAARNEIKA
jgi:dihydrofolate synthase/folylpolyglutamate synthase